jgi:tetratricopeptide (TPR) repeat protein
MTRTRGAPDCRLLAIGHLSLVICLFVVACAPRVTVPPGPPPEFVGLNYQVAADTYQQVMTRQFKARDNAYVISVLNYALTSLYADNLLDSRKAFTAVYRVDDGKVEEAAKAYQWLQVDARKVYRLTKRERELTHFYLGLDYLYDDNLPEALVEFKKLRQRDQDTSSLPVVDFYMGLVYEKQRLFGDARIEYEHLHQTGAYGGSGELLAGLDSLGRGVRFDSIGSKELVIQVDHLRLAPVGATDVYADDQFIGRMPAVVDPFDVRLTRGELNRIQAQKAGAYAARQSCRCCVGVLAEYFLGRGASDLTDIAADVAVGREEDNQETRWWRYAPHGLSFLRTRIPSTTNEVRLVFRAGDERIIGAARYPLGGENARVHHAAGIYFILAGLADEFFVY